MHVNISDVHICVGPINIWCCAQPLSAPFLEAIHSLKLKPKAFSLPICASRMLRFQEASKPAQLYVASGELSACTCLLSKCFIPWAIFPAQSFVFFEIASHSVSWLAWNSLRWELTVALPLSAGIIGVCPESPHLAQVILGYTVSQSLWVALWKCNLCKAFIHLKQTQTDHIFVYSSNENDQLFLINIATYLTVI